MVFRLILLFAPTLIFAGLGWYFGTPGNQQMAAIVGGLAGLILGVALLAFPNLNQRDDEDKTDLPLIDP